MILIGITGIIGSGKTTVSQGLRNKGFSVIDLDDLAKEILLFPDVQETVKRRFGDEYVQEGRILVERLRERVFKNTNNLMELEEIVHPRIIKMLWQKVDKMKISGLHTGFIDAPLLFEKGLYKEMNKVVVVSASIEKIKERLLQRGLEKKDIERRLSHQIPLDEKEKKADFVLYNNGSEKDLEEEINRLVKRIREWEVELDAS